MQTRFGMSQNAHAFGRSGPFRRGHILAYSVVALTALVGFASLAVDIGRIMVCRAELMHAAEAAARAAANSLQSGATTAKANAVAVAAKNRCDGQVISASASDDVQVGHWDEQAKTFTILT